MLLCSQKKTHPCEGCRERKKKCSGNYPCVRCKRLGIDCVFLRPTLPPDHAYVDLLQQQELALEINTLKTTMAAMEHSLTLLRQQTITNNDNNSAHQNQKRKITSSSSDINWQLTLGKHGVTVNTSIKSYGDLLKQVELWQQACHSIISPSISRSPSPSSMVLQRQRPLWLVRRGHFMAITICVKTRQINHDPPPIQKYNDQHLQQQQPSPPLSDHGTEDTPDISLPMTSTAANRDQICRQILDTYFACYHVHHTILHQSTFYRLFVNNSNTRPSSSLYDSPAVSAVCALALTVRCRHMLPLIPYKHQAQVAALFCDQARHQVAFDEPTLDSFIVFTFLAMYKQMIFCVDDAVFYLDLAFRTRCLLPMDDQDDGKKEMIKRLHWALWEVQTSLDYYNNQRGVPVSTTTAPSTTTHRHQHPICQLMREKRQEYIRLPLPDESPAIHQSLQHAIYRTDMMLAQGSFLRSVRFGHDDVVGLKYLLETEYRFTKFYQDLPPDYRMDSRLFEPGLSEKTFRQRLDSLWNGNDSRMAALNLTLQYYQGIISFYESFLPDLRERQWAQVVGLLTDDGDTPSLDRSTTMASFTTPLIEDEATATWTIHQHHAQKKCTEAATFIVRLLDYQRTLPTYCSVNMQILLTAWDIHMRNACLGLTVTDNKRRYFDCLSSDTIHQARRSLLQCLSILHEGYLFNFAEHAIWKYYEHVERQLLDSLLVTPTAAYWIPFGL